MSHVKASVARINRKGDRGSPCLIPSLGLKRPKGLPLMRVEYDTVEFVNLMNPGA